MSESTIAAFKEELERSLLPEGEVFDTNALTFAAKVILRLPVEDLIQILPAFEACAHRVGWGRPSVLDPQIYTRYDTLIRCFKTPPKQPFTRVA